jgi:hypothetical protein
MKRILSVLLIGVLLCCQACTTAKLWQDANPNDRIWIDADKTTEASLKERGVDYQVYNDKGVSGYLIKKQGLERMKDYQLRALGTPVTLVLDAAATVVVVGVYVLLNDPDGTCSLIEGASHGHRGHRGHHR